MVPLSHEKVLENPFVRELNEEEKEKEKQREEKKANTFTINAKVITDDANLLEIDQTLKDHEKFNHLRLHKVQTQQVKTYSDFVDGATKTEHNGCKLLSSLPPYISDQGKISYFD